MILRDKIKMLVDLMLFYLSLPCSCPTTDEMLCLCFACLRDLQFHMQTHIAAVTAEQVFRSFPCDGFRVKPLLPTYADFILRTS